MRTFITPRCSHPPGSEKVNVNIWLEPDPELGTAESTLGRGGAADGAIIIELLMLANSGVGDVESVTLAVKLNDPAAVGVPVMAPVEGLISRPVGSDPAVIEKVSGCLPPAATNDELYGTPTCPPPAGGWRVS